jgi:hypothetical protein
MFIYVLQSLFSSVASVPGTRATFSSSPLPVDQCELSLIDAIDVESYSVLFKFTFNNSESLVVIVFLLSESVGDNEDFFGKFVFLIKKKNNNN